MGAPRGVVRGRRARLRFPSKFYSGLFHWKVNADNPTGYGMVDTAGGGRDPRAGSSPAATRSTCRSTCRCPTSRPSCDKPRSSGRRSCSLRLRRRRTARRWRWSRTPKATASASSKSRADRSPWCDLAGVARFSCAHPLANTNTEWAPRPDGSVRAAASVTRLRRPAPRGRRRRRVRATSRGRRRRARRRRSWRATRLGRVLDEPEPGAAAWVTRCSAGTVAVMSWAPGLGER